MKKQLQIISSTHAREINPLGECPNIDKVIPRHGILIDYELPRQRWQQAESSLKEYRIEGIDISEERYSDVEAFIEVVEEYRIGSIHQAEINEELNTCVIL